MVWKIERVDRLGIYVSLLGKVKGLLEFQGHDDLKDAYFT